MLRLSGLLFSLLSVSPAVSLAEESVFVDPVPGLGCPAEAFEIQGVCIKNSAFLQYSTSELTETLMKRKGMVAPSFSRSGPSRLMCESAVNEADDDVIRLQNGAILKKTGYEYLGYISYGTEAILSKGSGGSGELLIADESPVSVRILRQPSFCSPVSTYRIEAADNDETFLINGEVFAARTYCLGWYEGDEVAFLDGSPYGACASATLYNVSRSESCAVWCE